MGPYRFLLASLIALLAAAPSLAEGFPRAGIATIENGRAAPFVGEWSMGMPDDEHATTSTLFVSCDVPVRIEAADDTHIVYLGRANPGADAAIELRSFMERTVWVPLAGGPSYVSVWADTDTFYLYDVGEMGEADWSQPYIYSRCD